MNIIITGALGHIGSALLRSPLLKKYDKVYLIDNFLTQRYASLFDLPKDIPFIFKEMDLFDERLKEMMLDSDVLIHLAAITDAESSIHNEAEVKRVNFDGFKRVVDLAATSNCAVVFPSTTSVYGSQENIVDENCADAELKPQSPYAETKLSAEKYLKQLGAEKKIKYVICRFGTIFGYSVGMRFHTAVNKFIWQTSLGEPISVWKTAMDQYRPYCGLDDCLAAIDFFLTENCFNNETYNIVTLNATVREITDVIRSFVPSLEIKLVDSPIMNQLSYHVSNQKSLDLGIKYSNELKLEVQKTLQQLSGVNLSVEKLLQEH